MPSPKQWLRIFMETLLFAKWADSCLVGKFTTWSQGRVHLWNISHSLRLPTFEVSHGAHTISFSNDDQILYVLGLFDTLETYQFAKEISRLGSIGGSGLTYDKRIDVTSPWDNSTWISCNTQKLLAIPEEYIICSLGYSSNFLTLEIENQGLMILDFN
jgi:hypothetical protein